MKMKLFLIGLATLTCGIVQASPDQFKSIHPADLSQMMSAKTPDLYILDVNGKAVRNKYGVIPGAKELTYDSFNPSTDLPRNKASTLVFYCANTKCMASHHAANEAASAGYQNVFVMVDGIQGWKKANQPVAKP